jgi:hypothetical protein
MGGRPFHGAGAGSASFQRGSSIGSAAIAEAVDTALGSGAASGGGGGGATNVYDFPTFASKPAAFSQVNTGSDGYHNNNLYFSEETDGVHNAAQSYYTTKLNIQAFTADFQLSLGDQPYSTATITGTVSAKTLTVTAVTGTITPFMCLGDPDDGVYITGFTGTGTGGLGTYPLSSTVSGTSWVGTAYVAYGICFVIQDDPNGIHASGDSNGLGSFQYAPPINPADTAPENSVILAFNATPAVGTGEGNFGEAPSMIGLYCNGKPYLDNGLCPTEDLGPQGFSLQNGNAKSAHVVYDGSILSCLLTDQVTGVQAYAQWAIDIPAVVGANTAYHGFTGGVLGPANCYMIGAAWDSGYNERLATPTISPAVGQYSSAQSVTIAGPAGATIYYTTDGTPPRRTSLVYSGPLTVSASTIIRARAGNVANFEDSFDALADYQIQASGTPKINFPTGFTGAGNRIATNGVASISGSNIELTPSSSEDGAQTGSAFYLAPVDVTEFSQVFDFTMTGSPGQNGLFLIFQNQLPAASDGSSTVSKCGGPYAIGFSNYGENAVCGGYSGIAASVGLKFDVWNTTTGLYEGGAVPTGSDTAITGVAISNANKKQVTVTYDGSTLSMTIKDTVSNATFSKSWTDVDIPTAVGGDAAYVGFSASDYNHSTVQTVNSWTYTEG